MDSAQQGTQTSFEKQKEDISLQLAEKLINAYEKGDVSYDDMREAADYILKHIDAVTNEEQLTYFLKNTSHYWPVFKDVLVVSQSTALKAEEQQVIEKLQHYLNNSSQS